MKRKNFLKSIAAITAIAMVNPTKLIQDKPKEEKPKTINCKINGVDYKILLST